MNGTFVTSVRTWTIRSMNDVSDYHSSDISTPATSPGTIGEGHSVSKPWNASSVTAPFSHGHTSGWALAAPVLESE